MKKFAFELFAIVFVGAILGGILWLLGAFLVGFSSFQPPLQAALVAGLVALVVPSITFYLTRVKDAEARFFAEKRAAYLGFVELLTDVMKGVKNGQPSDPDELAEKLLVFKRHVLVWGSGDLIIALQKYEEDLSKENMTNRERLMVMDDFLRALRRDLGHSKHAPPPGGLMSLFLIANDRGLLLKPTK